MPLKKNTIAVVTGGIAALLLLCLIDADYGFYQAMRTLVSFGFAFLAYRYYQAGDKTNAIIYLCLLVVFQPLLKIELGREIWMVVDIVVAAFLIYKVIKMRLEIAPSAGTVKKKDTHNTGASSVNTMNDEADRIRKKW